jgi:HEAT repeat protein
MRRGGRAGRAVVGLLLAVSFARPAAQIPFERVVSDLASPDWNVRLQAAALLRESPFPEAALPLAKAVVDPVDVVQIEAIVAELNIFLFDKVETRKKIGFVVETRSKVAAETAFARGPASLAARRVPVDVLTSLRAAVKDDHARVAVEAVYAFGVLAAQPAGDLRLEVLRGAASTLVPQLDASDPAMRLAAVRVIGRLFARRAGDEPVAQAVGDAVITTLNDKAVDVKQAAMDALGAMRYARAVEPLGTLFSHYKKGELGENALDALAHIAHPGSAPLFVATLGSPSPALRTIAVEALARVGDRARLVDIQKALASERHEGVLLASTFATVLLSGAPLDELAEGLIRTRLRDQSRRYLVDAAPGRTHVFARFTNDPEAMMRAEVAEILGLSGDRAALPLLAPLCRDQDPRVSAAAERAIGRLRELPENIAPAGCAG